MSQTELITYILASLTIVAQIISLVAILLIVFKKNARLIKLFKLKYKHVLLFTYGISMIATLGSLYYSDVAGYTPCKFCWYQRIVMYPQTIIYLIALAYNDKRVHLYGIGLSVIGALMAFYHYLLQIGIIETTSCTTVGFSISCSENFGTTFGYVTIPLMAFSAFSLIAVSWIFLLTSKRK